MRLYLAAAVIVGGIVLPFPRSIAGEHGMCRAKYDRWLEPDPAWPAGGRQRARVFRYDGDVPVDINYLLSLPGDYGRGPGLKWPVILFLHGSDERGDTPSDLDKIRVQGPARVADRNPDFPFIVVSPQCPRGRTWNVSAAAALLADVLARYPAADPERVYLTGYSMGGSATWVLAAEYPGRFAAVAPVSGVTDPSLAGPIARSHVPVWAFHGDQDPLQPVALVDAMIAGLSRNGDDTVRFTRYEGAGHQCWPAAYGDGRLYGWFLRHHRPVG